MIRMENHFVQRQSKKEHSSSKVQFVVHENLVQMIIYIRNGKKQFTYDWARMKRCKWSFDTEAQVEMVYLWELHVRPPPPAAARVMMTLPPSQTPPVTPSLPPAPRGPPLPPCPDTRPACDCAPMAKYLAAPGDMFSKLGRPAGYNMRVGGVPGGHLGGGGGEVGGQWAWEGLATGNKWQRRPVEVVCSQNPELITSVIWRKSKNCTFYMCSVVQWAFFFFLKCKYGISIV